MQISFLCSLLSALGMVLGGTSDGDDEWIVDPYAVESPSGVWRLEVEPGDRLGAGASRNRLLRAGERVREVDLPFTLHLAAITDDGYAAGIAKNVGPSASRSVVLCVLGPDGARIRSPRNEEIRVRQWETVKSFCIDADADGLILEVASKRLGPPMSRWFKYPIRKDGSGERLDPDLSFGDRALLAAAAPFVAKDGRRPDGFLGPWKQKHTELPTRRLESTTAVSLLSADESVVKEPGSAWIDSLGRTWVFDMRVGSWSGFDTEGQLAFVCVPGSRDGPVGLFHLDDRISARPDGGVLVRNNVHAARFNARGLRLSQVPKSDGTICLELPGDRFVSSGYLEPLSILDSAGAPLSRFEKLPDGTWSGSVIDAVWTAEGLGVLLDEGLVLLDEAGRPERVVPVPCYLGWEPRLSVNGDHAVVSCLIRGDILLHTYSGASWERVELAGLELEARMDDGCSVGLSPDGEELLAVDWKTYTLRRYPLR